MPNLFPPIRTPRRRRHSPRYASSRFLTSALAAGLGALATASAAQAEPGPIGNEYPVEDRPLPGKEWWTRCSAASGVEYRIFDECNDESCEDTPGDIYLESTDANGNSRGEPITVNEAPARMYSFRLACHASGWVVAQWQDSETGCFLHRVFDSNGDASAAVKTIENEDCRIRASLAVRSSGQFTGTWAAAQPDGGSAIVARRFGADGSALAPAVEVSDAELERRYRPKITTDESGNTLVAWSNRAEYLEPARLLGHFLDAAGRPVGSTFQINTYGHGESSEPALHVKAAGLFEAVWSNNYQGGRVARLVSLSGDDQAPTTTTTLPANGDVPRFGPGRVIDSLPYYYFDTRPRSLAAGSPGAWLLNQRSAEYWRTANDGVQWQGPLAATQNGYHDTVVGTDGAGVWGAAHTAWSTNRIYFSRSTDDAGSWTEPTALAEGGNISDGCSNCAVIRTDVLGSVSGTWIAAWTFHDYTTDEAGNRDEDVERVYVLRSKDAGKSWSSPIKIGVEQGVGRWGFDLDTDGAGTWVAMWIDADVRVSRSVDDGRTWSPAATVATGVSCGDCNSQARYTTVQLAHDGESAWAAIFASASYLPATYGYDGDVYALRSSNDGATWSGPVPIAAYADRDATRELDPTIAINAAGGWVAAWISHHPTGAGDDLDADVVTATSRAKGNGWNAAVSLSARGNDLGIEAAPVLATDARAETMLAWQSLRLDNTVDGQPTYQLLAAIAGSTCGDGTPQTGEGCDDANSSDGDGCDSNCTPTGCGNGIVTTGEDCDLPSSREDASYCTDCQVPRCGDGVVRGDEQCDDGNADTGDACIDCRMARCGDGVIQVGVEECDDRYSPACSLECKPARCGDGEIAPYVEACDDGNDVDNDACPNDCSKATCGDGYTSRGFEECDYQDTAYISACTPECKIPSICGDANGNDEVTATDARLVLQQAVGLDVGCPREVCDMDASGRITAADAKMDLHKAVGLLIGDRCSIGTGNIVFWIDDAQEVGALQVDIDYEETGGNFAGSADTVGCEILIPVLASFNDNEAEHTLSFGIIAVGGFHGHIDLFRCAFEMPQDRTGVQFHFSYIDATDPELNPITAPLIGYRLE